MNTAQSNMMEKHLSFTPNETNPCVNYSPETKSSISNKFSLYPPSKAQYLSCLCPTRTDHYSTVCVPSNFNSLIPTQILLHSCRTVFVLMVLYNSLMTYYELHPVSPTCNTLVCSLRCLPQAWESRNRTSANLSLFLP